VSQAAPANYVWWLAGRSAGAVAMLLVTASVIIGLSMATRMMPVRWKRSAVGLHQHLSLIALGAIAAHGVLLAADPWLKAGVSGVTVPFALGYRPLWTGLGIIGGYLAAILALSFYARRRIGGRLWRRMHRFTVLAYALSLAHALGSGTDTSIPIVRYAVLASALPVLFLFVLRMLLRPARPAAAPTASASSTATRSNPGTSLRPSPHPPGRQEAAGARAT
jgi:sulfoxide reductase heme-binding subunit YedZ